MYLPQLLMAHVRWASYNTSFTHSRKVKVVPYLVKVYGPKKPDNQAKAAKAYLTAAAPTIHSTNKHAPGWPYCTFRKLEKQAEMHDKVPCFSHFWVKAFFCYLWSTKVALRAARKDSVETDTVVIYAAKKAWSKGHKGWETQFPFRLKLKAKGRTADTKNTDPRSLTFNYHDPFCRLKGNDSKGRNLEDKNISFFSDVVGNVTNIFFSQIIYFFHLQNGLTKWTTCGS